jgi:hypothetical protein
LVFCVWVPGTSFLPTDIPLPSFDSDRPFGKGMFSLAARSPAGRGRLGMTYETQGTIRGRRCSMGGGGTLPAERRGGGRGGASPFPVKDRRTWGSKARTSTKGR